VWKRNLMGFRGGWLGRGPRGGREGNFERIDGQGGYQYYLRGGKNQKHLFKEGASRTAVNKGERRNIRTKRRTKKGTEDERGAGQKQPKQHGDCKKTECVKIRRTQKKKTMGT